MMLRLSSTSCCPSIREDKKKSSCLNRQDSTFDMDVVVFFREQSVSFASSFPYTVLMSFIQCCVQGVAIFEATFSLLAWKDHSTVIRNSVKTSLKCQLWYTWSFIENFRIFFFYVVILKIGCGFRCASRCGYGDIIKAQFDHVLCSFCAPYEPCGLGQFVPVPVTIWAKVPQLNSLWFFHISQIFTHCHKDMFIPDKMVLS